MKILATPEYQSLDPNKIIRKIILLNRRIEERFPNSGLGEVAHQLLDIARQAKKRTAKIVAPIISLRIGIGILVLMIVVGIIATLLTLEIPLISGSFDFAQFAQVLAAGISNLVYIGVAILFLVTLENRIKRHRALKAIHEIRVIAHIIDMHQLTKDPESTLRRGNATASSPKRTLTRFELSRYLDYCSEMLSSRGQSSRLVHPGL
jgi:hypothetical protein